MGTSITLVEVMIMIPDPGPDLDPLVRHKAKIIVCQRRGEEPVKPRHLPPQPAKGVVPDLVGEVREAVEVGEIAGVGVGA